jgi:hypothetical protein
MTAKLSDSQLAVLLADRDAAREGLVTALRRSGKAAHYLGGHKGYFGDCSASDCYKTRAALARVKGGS